MADTSNFYSMADRWQKQNVTSASPKISKQEAVDRGFSDALRRSAELENNSLPPTPPRLILTSSQIEQSANSVELEVSQELFVKGGSQIVKFISTTENIVTLDSPEPAVLHVVGVTAGRTFVHFWDGAGRHTFEVRVVPMKLRGPTYADQYRDVVERTRPFRVGYNATHGSFYTGEKYDEKRRTSLDVNQRLEVTGDTPYGYYRSHATLQRSGTNTKHILNDIQFALDDGKIGRLDNFNLELGDSEAQPDLMVFPTARVRGGYIEHWNGGRTLETTHFYGRELTGIIGTLSPFFGTQKRTKDSFLSGNIMDWRPAENAHIKTGYFTGSGRHRGDELNRHGFGTRGDFGFGPYVHLRPELDYDNERFAQKQSLGIRFDKLQLRGEFRDINKDFQTLIGIPTAQGEKGYRLEAGVQPTQKISFLGSLDVFRDRRIPNPDNPGAENVHTDLDLNFTPTDRSSADIFYQSIDDTGRVGPYRLDILGAQYNQSIDLWGRRATVTARYENRQNDNLTSPSLTYERDQFLLGFYTRVFWDIYFSVQKEWNWLDETAVGLTSEPAATTYNFSYARQVFDTPFYLDASLRIRDEEETESSNSFMAGEDSTSLSVGLYYRKYKNWELYATGRVENFVPESLNITEPRIEVEFLMGARYLYDTGIRWSPVGHLEGFVFKDLNGDGARQPDEPGLKGMKVTVSDGQAAVTDEGGFWKVRGVSGKTAILTLDPSGMPYGYVPTNSIRREIAILPDKAVEVDFGLGPRSEIIGIVFSDDNVNGRYDLGESGLKKVRMTLENGQAVRTNDKGSYVFSSVLAGEHTVRLDLSTLPEGYLPYDALQKRVVVFEGIRYELHFPLKAQRAVAGRVFVDQNANGVMDDGEPTFAGVRVVLGSQAVLTDEKGRYLFESLPAGSYLLSVEASTLPSGCLPDEPESIVLTNEPVTLSERNIPLKKSS